MRKQRKRNPKGNPSIMNCGVQHGVWIMHPQKNRRPVAAITPKNASMPFTHATFSPNGSTAVCRTKGRSLAFFDRGRKCVRIEPDEIFSRAEDESILVPLQMGPPTGNGELGRV